MKLEDPRITILVNGDHVDIELVDRKSSSVFATIKMTSEQFTKALSRSVFVNCEMEIGEHLERLNKKMIYKPIIFELGKVSELGYGGWKEKARKKVKELVPEGWEPDLYFGSQSSFKPVGDMVIASTFIKRWVDTDEKTD